MRTFLLLAAICTACGIGVAPSPAQAPANKPATEDVTARAWKTLTDGVADEKGAKRADATAALGTIGSRPEVVQLVEARLDDKDSDVRQIAAATLGAMKSRASIPKLKKALDDEAADVSFAAARALWDMGDHSGRSIFYDVLAGERSGPKAVVQGELHAAKKKYGNPMTLAMIGAKEGASAFLGPFALGLSVVEAFAKDRTAPARALAATLLASDTKAQSAQQLEEALADKNWVVRAAAAKALGSSPRTEVLAKLEPLLNDEKESVRYMAAAAIMRLSRAKPVPRQPSNAKKPS
jgi:HEAT repeat protein